MTRSGRDKADRTGSWAALALGACLAASLNLAAVPAEAQFGSRDSRGIAGAVRSATSSDRELAAFYRARNHRPLWFEGATLLPHADRLLELITTADLDGIDPEHYRPGRLIDAVQDAYRGSPRAIARADAALSRAYVRYARDLHRPADVGMTWVDKSLAPAPPAPRIALDRAAGIAASGAPLDRALGLNPLYTELRDGFGAWRARWGNLPQVHIPDGPALTLGAKGDRVRLLRQRLGLAPDGIYDKDVAAAVREFQAANGLPTTAIAANRTVEALNQVRQVHEARLRLNLQRARLLPADQHRYVVVDAAAQRLSIYEDGRLRDSMRVIVGRPSEPTPMLGALIRFAVLNPYWNVPPDMVATRIAPAVLKQGVAHLRKERYEVLSDWSETPKVVDPKKVDWRAVAAGRIELPVRQLPGRANSMGAMKFMFPNEFGVYLHDTPDKKLFGQADRRQSAGCVRLEDAQRLAKWLFGDVPTPKSSEPEQAVPLPAPVPVYITYLTAAPTPTGIAFREDIYGRDKAAVTRFAAAAGAD